MGDGVHDFDDMSGVQRRSPIFAEACILRVETARQGDRAAGDLRAGRLRPAHGDSRRACACHAGGFAAALRSLDGLHGHRGAGDLGRPQPERGPCAAALEGATGGGSRAGIVMALAAGTRSYTPG